MAERFGENDPRFADSLNNLAVLYYAQGRYPEAEPLHRRALAIREKVLGPEHPDVALSLNNLAALYYAQGRYPEAEPLHRRALAIREKVLGPEHPDVAQSLDNLANLYQAQGHSNEAEPLYRRALAIWEKVLGPEHPEVARSLNNLAVLYRTQGRSAEAESLHRRALAIREKVLGPEHPDVVLSLNNLANLYQAQGRSAEAEPLYRHALTIGEKVLGPEHPDVALSLNNLADLYRAQGRSAEAEPLSRRALAIREKVLGPEHPHVATSLNNLANLYQAQGRYAETELLYRRALAIQEKTLGPEHPDAFPSLNNLAVLYQIQGRSAEAELLSRRALAISEKVFGLEHPHVATSLHNLAVLYSDQGRSAEAEPLYRRALAIREKVLGPEHPDIATGLNNLANLYQAQGQPEKALELARKATAIHQARWVQADTERSLGAVSEQQTIRYVFVNHVAILNRLREAHPDQQPPLTAEAFAVGQSARATRAAAALARMAARFAAGDDRLAQAVRARQDALDRWQALDAELVKAYSQPPDKRDPTTEARLRKQLADLDNTLRTLDQSLKQQFPQYAELANPQPLSLADAQRLLAPDEALLSYLITAKESYLWVVRRTDAAMYRIALSDKALTEAVQELRANLAAARPKPFPVNTAYTLYTQLIAPAEPLLAGARHLLIVPDGPLQSLPPGVLVSAPPPAPADYNDLSTYRQVPWLAKQYALTVLPSVGSLKALRQFAQRSPAPQPFVGFGDPVLGEGPTPGRSLDAAALFRRGPLADVSQFRLMAKLPETADELQAMANALGADRQFLYLQDRATESTVKRLNLADYRIMAFATHGLMAGEFTGLAEPALVLTPPNQATELDDGLLTASEVAQLHLNADWVILSACNTAASDGMPGAEGLAGLAKAFFYAGSRSLLVSHWYVDSEATVALTTTMLQEAAAHPEIGRAEALRRSMLALLNNLNKPNFAHPMFWAPFVVVGEGGVVGKGN